ncbi:MAG: D-alanine--D-alanine ligase family protein [Anaerolineae bacterium]
MKKLRVGLIFGGRSAEHEVSLASARSVMNAIDRNKYTIVPIGITKKGRWVFGKDALQMLESGGKIQPGPPTPALPHKWGRERVGEWELIPGLREFPQIDVAFPVLHGPYGEDGTVQGLLELADLPCVGAGVLGSALGMDKALMKTVLRARGLPVVEHLVIKRREWENGPACLAARVGEQIGYPCFVKPANLGSSVGISKVPGQAQFYAAFALAASYDRKVLVERAIDAREIECSVLGNDEPVASVPGEVIPGGEFYDYHAKYFSEETRFFIPADLAPPLARKVQNLALETFMALDCAGMARVDFFLERGSDRLYVNELNTIPGFTPMSMYPKMWEASGLPYPALLDRLITLALERRMEDRSWKLEIGC